MKEVASESGRPNSAKEATKADLLALARLEIDKSEGSLRAAAEALAKTEKEFGATQREMAKAVGKSASWINHLLKWHRSGYKDESPFGPTTKAGRVSHAKQRAGSSSQRKGKSSPVAGSAGADAGNMELRVEHSGTESAPAVPTAALTLEMADPGRSPAPAAATQIEHLQAGLAAATARVRHLEQELSSARSHSIFESADLPGLLRRVLSPEDEGAFDAIKRAFQASPEFGAAWALASSLVRHRFVHEVLLTEAAS